MRKIVAAFAVVAIASSAFAQSFVSVDITGVESRHGLGGDAPNVVLLVNLPGGAGQEVTSFGWDLLFTPNSPSWTSEAHMQLSDTGETSIFDWDMGNFGGVNNSTPVNLNGSIATSFFVGGDATLRIEFWEDFDDSGVDPDGVYGSTLRIGYVPEPASLVLLGLGGLLFAARRRR